VLSSAAHPLHSRDCTLGSREAIMAGRVPRVVPYVTSPALAHILTAHRVAGRPAEATRGHTLPHYLLFGAALIGFLVSAGAIVAPQVTPFFQRPVAQQAPA